MRNKISSLIIAAIFTGVFMGCNESEVISTFEQIVLKSDRIVLAEAVSRIVCWNRDSSALNTYIKFNVDDDLLGSARENVIIVRLFDGGVGNQSLNLLKGASGRLGSRQVFLFLEKNPACDSCYQIMGMYQTKIAVSFKRADGRSTLGENPNSVVFFAHFNGQDMMASGYNLSFEELKTAIAKIRSRYAAR